MIDLNQQISIEARGPNYYRLLRDLIVSLFFNTYDITTGGPRIVAINRYGAECVVEECKSLRKAKQTASSMRSDLARIGDLAWCEKHNVPLKFIQRY